MIISITVLMISCQSAQRTTKLADSKASVLDEANRLFAQQDYEPALMKYSTYVYSPFPKKNSLADARYHMGLCQYFLGRYHESADTMTILLQDYPQFSMSNEAVEILKQSRLRVEENLTASTEQELKHQETITNLQDQIGQYPKNAQLHYQLANQYWNAGQYQTAALHYEQAILLNPDYEKDSLVRNRVYYTDDNVLVPRDPLVELQQQDDVIRLSNVQHDVRTRENWLGRRESIRVSGEAENVTLRTVRGVRIEITLVDFFEKIQDSQTVNLGSIRPGETRTFSTLMTQFSGSAYDNLRVRTKVFYQ